MHARAHMHAHTFLSKASHLRLWFKPLAYTPLSYRTQSNPPRGLTEPSSLLLPTPRSSSSPASSYLPLLFATGLSSLEMPHAHYLFQSLHLLFHLGGSYPRAMCGSLFKIRISAQVSPPRTQSAMVISLFIPLLPYCLFKWCLSVSDDS